MFGRIGAALAVMATASAKAIPVMVRDIVGLAGVGLISYGAWLITPSAGFIAAGCLLLAGAILASRRPKP